MSKIKQFFTSVIGIKVSASVVLGIIALLLAKVSLSATFAIGALVVGFWIDEIISSIIKLVKKQGE